LVLAAVIVKNEIAAISIFAIAIWWSWQYEPVPFEASRSGH